MQLFMDENLDSQTISEKAVIQFQNLFATSYTTLAAPAYSNEPTWDGFVMFYSNKKPSKIGLKKINVQIKGEIYNGNSSHSFERVDLENYRDDGGVLLLVSKIKQEQYYNYAKLLMPDEIEKILKGKENQKTIIIHLKQIFNSEQLIDLCKTYTLKSNDKNRNGKIIGENMPPMGILKSIKSVVNDKVFDGIIVSSKNEKMYLSMETDTGIYYANSIVIDRFETNKLMKIEMNNKIYFENAMFYKDESGINIIFCEALKFVLRENMSYTFTLDIKQTFNKVIQSLKFLFEIPDDDIFYLMGSPIKVDNMHNTKEIKEIREYYENLSLLKRYFDENKIDYADLCVDKLSEEEQLYYSSKINEYKKL